MYQSCCTGQLALLVQGRQIENCTCKVLWIKQNKPLRYRFKPVIQLVHPKWCERERGPPILAGGMLRWILRWMTLSRTGTSRQKTVTDSDRLATDSDNGGGVWKEQWPYCKKGRCVCAMFFLWPRLMCMGSGCFVHKTDVHEKWPCEVQKHYCENDCQWHISFGKWCWIWP